MIRLVLMNVLSAVERGKPMIVGSAKEVEESHDLNTIQMVRRDMSLMNVVSAKERDDMKASSVIGVVCVIIVVAMGVIWSCTKERFQLNSVENLIGIQLVNQLLFQHLCYELLDN